MALLPPMGSLFSPGGGPDLATPDPTVPVAPSLGKNSKQQSLGSPHSGLRSAITKGDQLSRSGNQYKKGHSFTNPPGLSQLRGGGGGMRRVRGGLGPGRMGQAGPASDYSMTSPDTE